MKYAVMTVMAGLMLAVAGCGGNADNAANSEKNKAYIPDFSTPEGASEAYARAIEDNNATLMELVIAPEDREVAVPIYVGNIKRSEANNIEWKIEFDDSTAQHVNEGEVVSRVRYYQIVDGEKKLSTTSWVIFSETDDGSWRLSARKTDELNRKAKEQPADGGEQPADDGEEPATDGNLPVD